MSLWTSIRDSVVGVAAPVLGGLIGGPAGAAIGGAIGGGSMTGVGGFGGAGDGGFSALLGSLIGGGSAPGAPVGMPGSGEMVQTAGAVRGAVAAFGAARNWLISARGIVSTVGGKLLGVMKGTKLIRNAQIMDLAKRVGIDAAAAALGITAVEVAQLIAAHLMQHAARRKRGRGITARDVRCTRRTIHKIRSIEHALQGVCRPRVGRARGRTLPAAFVRQG